MGVNAPAASGIVASKIGPLSGVARQSGRPKPAEMLGLSRMDRMSEVSFQIADEPVMMPSKLLPPRTKRGLSPTTHPNHHLFINPRHPGQPRQSQETRGFGLSRIDASTSIIPDSLDRMVDHPALDRPSAACAVVPLPTPVPAQDRCRHCGSPINWRSPGPVAFADGSAAHGGCYEQAELERHAAAQRALASVVAVSAEGELLTGDER
jgi:hypothetical protein